MLAFLDNLSNLKELKYCLLRMEKIPIGLELFASSNAMENDYCLLPKKRGGNVFTGICLSTEEGNLYILLYCKQYFDFHHSGTPFWMENLGKV